MNAMKLVVATVVPVRDTVLPSRTQRTPGEVLTSAPVKDGQQTACTEEQRHAVPSATGSDNTPASVTMMFKNLFATAALLLGSAAAQDPKCECMPWRLERHIVSQVPCLRLHSVRRAHVGAMLAGGGTWSVTADATADACAASGGQWILQFAQSGYPDHHPVPKTWWMKRMSDTGGADEDHHDRLFFGGRPSERDMKLMYEAGVDAVLSLETTTADNRDTMGVQPLPTTAEAVAIAAEAGMLYHTLAAADYTSTEGVDEITAFLDFALASTGQASSGNGPVYVHDARGVSAVGAIQLFRARRGLIAQGTATSKTAKAIQEAEAHGFALAENVVRAIAREAGEVYDETSMTGSMTSVQQQTATTAIESYHWLKYLYNIGPVGVFDAGQIQKFHVTALRDANIKVVINMRQGQEVDGAWAPGAQEPINLLNLGAAHM